ncbi:MAG: glycosyltransferase family 4 protein [Candidatus Kerfeldbacteria bacterium]|nr:glycosyltransferase family 4 protein [Candidatus Kerfeldbacteria bacterium]
MRIGIDCRELSSQRSTPAGVAMYIHSLVRALMELPGSNEFVFFVRPGSSEKLNEVQQPNVTVVECPEEHPRMWWHWKLARFFDRFHCDVIHGTAGSLPLTFYGPSAVTIHDLAIYEHPEWFPDGQAFSTRVVIPSTLKRADQLIAVSHSTQDQLHRIFPFTKRKTRMIYEGGPTDPLESDFGKQTIRPSVTELLNSSLPYLLFVGTLEPRKNIVQLVAAFDQLLDRHPDFRNIQLVIAGAWGWKSDAIRRAVVDANWGSQIRVLGYVSHTEKWQLLKHATIVTYPSLWEGFGLPILEAFRARVPVITSSVSSMPEVGGKGALYVDPANLEELIQSMENLLDSSRLREKLVNAQSQRLTSFSWKTAALETMKVYQSVARKHRK